MPRGALGGGFVYPALCLFWRAEVSRCFLGSVREKSALCRATGRQPTLTRASRPACLGFCGVGLVSLSPWWCWPKNFGARARFILPTFGQSRYYPFCRYGNYERTYFTLFPCCRLCLLRSSCSRV